VIPGQDQVGSGPRIIGMEQELRVGNNDGVSGRMRLRGIDMRIRVGVRIGTFRRKRGVKCASVIQRTTTKG